MKNILTYLTKLISSKISLLDPEEKIWESGYSIKSAKQELESTTHCGKYWGVKGVFDGKHSVFVEMKSNEKVSINLITGERKKINYDY